MKLMNITFIESIMGQLNSESDYVFKSSKQMAQLAIHMDVNGPEDDLQMENAYFDVTHMSPWF